MRGCFFLEIRILLADDNLAYRNLLASGLRAGGGFDIVGEAADEEEAVNLWRRLEPEVVLLDQGMPKLDGLSAARVILSESPRAVVYLMTTFPETLDRDEILSSGIRDILDKYHPIPVIAAKLKSGVP